MGKAKNVHEFEPVTDYCVRCGCSRIDDDKGFRPFCDEIGNAVGISHIVLLRRWKGPLNEACVELATLQSSAARPRKA